MRKGLITLLSLSLAIALLLPCAALGDTTPLYNESVLFFSPTADSRIAGLSLRILARDRAELAAALILDLDISEGTNLSALGNSTMYLGISDLGGTYAYFLGGTGDGYAVLISYVPDDNTAYYEAEEFTQGYYDVRQGLLSYIFEGCDSYYEIGSADVRDALSRLSGQSGASYASDWNSYSDWNSQPQQPAFTASLVTGSDVRFTPVNTATYPVSFAFDASASSRALLIASLLGDLALSQDIDLFELLESPVYYDHSVVYDADVYTLIGTADGNRVVFTYVPVTGYCVYNAQPVYQGSAATYARSKHPNYQILNAGDLQNAKYSCLNDLMLKGLLAADSTLGQPQVAVTPTPAPTPTPRPTYTQSAQQGSLGRVRVMGGTNVRKKTYNDSELVTTIRDEGVYEYYEIKNGWYYILLPDGNFGYVYKTRCTEVW